MRILALVVLLVAARPLVAQTPGEPQRPFDDTTHVRPIPGLGDVPIIGHYFRLPQPPNNITTELQQVIDKAMASTSNTVLVMDLDSVMLSRAPASITTSSDPDGTIRRLVGGLKSIQLRMFDVEGDARSRIQPIRDLLKAPNWVRYSAYTSKNEEIEIWSARWGTSQMGVFLLSVNGRRIFTMNVGGNLGPDQLVYLSGLFGIPNFKPKLDVPLDSPVSSK